MKLTLIGFAPYKAKDGSDRVMIHCTSDIPMKHGFETLSRSIAYDPYVKLEVGKTYEAVTVQRSFNGQLTTYITGLK